MIVVPAAALCALLIVLIAAVAWPARRARRGSLLGRARRRALVTAGALALIATAAFALVEAEAARDRAMSSTPGPGWDPDAGIAEVARPAVLGLLATLVAGPYVAVAMLIDLLALRKMRRAPAAHPGIPGVVDVGLGDQILERPRPQDYRSDAAPDVAVRGDVACGRKILVRSAVAHGLALVVLVPLFLTFALGTVAAAMGG